MKERGFTLIEFLVVLAIIGIITTVIILSLSDFRENQTLKGDVEKVFSVISEARSKTLASVDASSYGVHFESGKVVLFKGTFYSAADPDNEEMTINDLLEISDISLNGAGSDVIFKRLTGETEEYGNITIRVKADTSKNKIITITSTGIAS